MEYRHELLLKFRAGDKCILFALKCNSEAIVAFKYELFLI